MNKNKNVFQSKDYHPRNTQITKLFTIEAKLVYLYLILILSDLGLTCKFYLNTSTHAKRNAHVTFYSFDLDLESPKLHLDMVKMYLHTKNEVPSYGD